METMEKMETVIEEITEVVPVEETKTAVEVVTKKSTNKGGVIAAGVVLIVGAGFGIYKLAKKVSSMIAAKNETAATETGESDTDNTTEKESEED